MKRGKTTKYTGDRTAEKNKRETGRNLGLTEQLHFASRSTQEARKRTTETYFAYISVLLKVVLMRPGCIAFLSVSLSPTLG